MAEILLKSNGSGSAHVMPRIDLTPMVDLGFLLITFFMMTTTMSDPKALDIQMPYKGPEPSTTAFYESSALTLIPAGHHMVYYYEGLFKPDMPLKKAATMEALRTVIRNKQNTLASRDKPAERELQVLIKSHPSATVTDIVALFDEMNISRINYCAMVDIAPEETAMVTRGRTE